MQGCVISARAGLRRWLIGVLACVVLAPAAASASRPAAQLPRKVKVRPRGPIGPRPPRHAPVRVRPKRLTRPKALRARRTRAVRTADPVRAVERHIDGLWTGKLRRGPATLMHALQDPKLPADATPTLYVSHIESPERVRSELRRQLGADADRIEIRRLPSRASKNVPEHGLLYLPNDFVVPGYSTDGQENRFNEQYNWDTHRMVTGMLVSGHTELARGMVENQLYEVRHYGTVLNANRTWSRTRSQPPYLTQSILAVYEKTGDRVWLRRDAGGTKRTQTAVTLRSATNEYQVPCNLPPFARSIDLMISSVILGSNPSVWPLFIRITSMTMRPPLQLGNSYTWAVPGRA